MMRVAVCLAIDAPLPMPVAQPFPDDRDAGAADAIAGVCHVACDGRVEVAPGHVRLDLAADPATVALHNTAAALFPDDPSRQRAYRAAGFQAIALERATVAAAGRYVLFSTAPIPAPIVAATVRDLRDRGAACRDNAAFAPQGVAALIAFDRADSTLAAAPALARHLYLRGHAARLGDSAFRAVFDVAAGVVAGLAPGERRALSAMLAGRDAGDRRLFVLSDDVAATQHISFARPLAGGLPVTLAGGWRGGGEDAGDVAAALAASGATHLVLSRYSGRDAPAIAAAARRLGMAVVAHLDDDLLAVPPSLGAAKFASYNAPDRLAALRAGLEAADVVYASTRPLADRLAAHGVTRPIVAGDLYCTIDPARTRPRAERDGPVLGFMGTGGHAQDLASVVPAIAALLDARPDLRFETFGSIAMPPALARFGDRVSASPGVADYDAFLDAMAGLGWWVGLAPLADNGFNRCKADTKWVEYGLAGIPTVASRIGVYERAAEGGCATLAGDWEAAIAALLDDPAARADMVARAQAKLADRYAHARLRAQIASVLEAADRAVPARWVA